MRKNPLWFAYKKEAITKQAALNITLVLEFEVG